MIGMISSMNPKIFLEDSINLKWKIKEFLGRDKNRENNTFLYAAFSYCLDFKLVEDSIKCHQ